MKPDLTTPEKIQLTAQIRALARAGAGAATIARNLHKNIDVVRRVLAGKGLDRDMVSIDDAPTIQGEFDRNGWPVDEASVTESIYEAAKAIREKRPRNPVGYSPVAADVIRTSCVVIGHRGGRHRL